ncbi:MAG: lipoyl domain-containing protein [Lentihominibacter sp.]|nr:lipoyl domain-containing protein [Bacillota bacterium]
MKKKNTIVMPKLSPSMKDAVLVAWNKEINEEVRKGDVLFEVETDKVVCEIEATADGVLEQKFFDEGDHIRVGETVAELID